MPEDVVRAFLGVADAPETFEEGWLVGVYSRAFSAPQLVPASFPDVLERFAVGWMVEGFARALSTVVGAWAGDGVERFARGWNVDTYARSLEQLHAVRGLFEGGAPGETFSAAGWVPATTI